MSKNSAFYIKRNIDIIIDEIVQYEDDIKLYQKNSDYKNALIDKTKNIEHISLINQFIQNENKLYYENNLKIQKEIKEIKEKIINYKNIPQDNSKKEIEQNLIKQKCYQNTLYIYKNELSSIYETLKLLKEEKLTTETELVNLMSMRENLEESIQNNSKFIFKNLMLSYDNINGNSISLNSSISTMDFTIQIEKFELENFPCNKFSNYIFDILFKYIMSINSTNKNSIHHCINECYEKLKRKIISPRDFTKSCSINIVNSEPKFIDFLIQTKFELLLRYIVKYFYLERIVNEKIHFVNQEYKDSKKFWKIKENDSLEKIKIIEKNLKDTLIDFRNIESKLNLQKQNNNNSIEELNDFLKKKEKEMSLILQAKNNNIEKFRKQMTELQNKNQILDIKLSIKQNKNINIQETQNKIEEKFVQIKKQLKESGDEKEKIINIYLQEINHLLDNENKENNKKYNSKTENITPVKNSELIYKSHSKASILPKNFEYLFINKENELDKVNRFSTIPYNSKNNIQNNLLSPENNKIYFNTIMQEKLSNKELIQKVSYLYIPCDCYIELVDENTQIDFNPLKDYDKKLENLNFNKSIIQLNKSNKTLEITQIQKEPIEININLLEKTVVIGCMKKVLNIMQLYKSVYQSNIQLILSDKNLCKQIPNDDIIKCVYNKYYLFSIILSIGKKINLIFLTYKTFKNWLNGMALIIKNKYQLLSIYK